MDALPSPASAPDRTSHVEQEERTALFCPLRLRGVTLRNRILVSPMCHYSAEDGFANEWHLVHPGSFAIGGSALVMSEATVVEARGSIFSQNLGIYP